MEQKKYIVASEPRTLPYMWIGRKPTTYFIALTEDLRIIIVDEVLGIIIVDDEDLGIVIVDEDLRIIIVDRSLHLVMIPGFGRASRFSGPLRRSTLVRI